MKINETPIQLAKYRSERKILYFSQENLYEYLTDQLDVVKKKEIDQALLESPEIQKELKKLRNGKQYLKMLTDSPIPEAILSRVKMSESQVQNMTAKMNYEQWPSGVKKGLGALIAVAVVLMIILALPLNQILSSVFSPKNGDVILAEVEKNQKTIDLRAVESKEAPLFVDEDKEGKAAKDSKTNPKAIVVDTKISAPAQTGTTLSKAESKNLSTTGSKELLRADSKELLRAGSKNFSKADSKNLAKMEAKNESDNSQQIQAQEMKAQEIKWKTQKSQDQKNLKSQEAIAADSKQGDTQGTGFGFLYRGQISITNLEANGQRLTDKILELGGRKAGEVDLGWSKTPTTRYYHFTMPNAKYEDLVSFMALYGKLRINKEKHPRVMPEGIVRLIIEVDESKP